MSSAIPVTPGRPVQMQLSFFLKDITSNDCIHWESFPPESAIVKCHAGVFPRIRMKILFSNNVYPYLHE